MGCGIAYTGCGMGEMGQVTKPPSTPRHEIAGRTAAPSCRIWDNMNMGYISKYGHIRNGTWPIYRT